MLVSVAIVIPAYNESAIIETVVRSWLELLNSIDGNIIVVNDGSVDGTGRILDHLSAVDCRVVVRHQANSGHGAAVLNGYRAALALESTFVFQTDSDNQMDPGDFTRLWEMRHLSPFVTGYRRDRRDRRFRLFLSALVSRLIRLLFFERISDANVPYRLMRADFLRELLTHLPASPIVPNILLSILAKKTGATLFEIPVKHEPRKTGRVSIIGWGLIKFCGYALRDLLRLRLILVFHTVGISTFGSSTTGSAGAKSEPVVSSS